MHLKQFTKMILTQFNINKLIEMTIFVNKNPKTENTAHSSDFGQKYHTVTSSDEYPNNISRRNKSIQLHDNKIYLDWVGQP